MRRQARAAPRTARGWAGVARRQGGAHRRSPARGPRLSRPRSSAARRRGWPRGWPLGWAGRWLRPANAVTVLAACTALVVAPGAVPRLVSPDIADPAHEHGIVQQLEVRGPSDHQEHDVRVWRPPGPDSSLLPVLYVLHGVPGAATDPFQHGLAEILDDRLRTGYPPFVVASPDGNGEHYNDTEWADSADGSDEVESRFLDAVIPAVEGSHLRDRAHRAVAGFSMGGYGAMNIALQHPALFGQVVSVAGYFHPDDTSGVFHGNASLLAANDPDQHAQNARGMHILLCEDASDGFPLIQGQAASFSKLLAADHIPATLRITPGQHDWDYAIGALAGSLDFLTDGWR